MMKHVAFLGILMLSACGESEVSPSTVLFSDEKTSEFETDIEDQMDSACLFDCTTESVAKLVFGIPIDLFDRTCTVKKFASMKQNNAIALVLWAGCLEGEQIFYQQWNPDGMEFSSRKIVSAACYKYFAEITDFAAATDGQTILTSYSCVIQEAGTRKTKAFLAGLDRVTGEKRWEKEVYSEPYSSSTSFGMGLAYNPEASAFGLMIRSSLYRVNSNGVILGGGANTYISDGSLSSLQSHTGQWYVLSKNRWSDSAYCSKVNTQGILECDRKLLGSYQPVFLNSNRAVWKTYSYSNQFNTQFEMASFNSDTCSLSKSQILGADQLNSTDKILSAQTHSTDIHFILYEDSLTNNLKLAVFSNQLTGSLLSIVSVAPINDIKSASVILTNSSITILYLDANGLHLNTAGQI